MELGILGWPAAGKTTLFGALTAQPIAPGAYTNETRTAVIRVPDPRVDRLSLLFVPKKTTYAELVFVDPGGDRSAAGDRPSFPESLLAPVREVDALVLVVRAFRDASVPRPPGSTTPEADLSSIEQELILRDLERVENRLQRLRKEGNKAEALLERKLLERAQAHLESEKPLRIFALAEADRARLRGFQFLTQKPALVVLNVGEDELQMTPPEWAQQDATRRVLVLGAKIERELAELDANDRSEFLAQLGLQEPARDRFIRAAFELLDLVSFFTVGEDEVRAWQVERNSLAPVAAGRIHSDLQRGFIRAEVIHYDDFMQAGSMAAAKSAGLLRLEGKEYAVRDGDIMHVRHA